MGNVVPARVPISVKTSEVHPLTGPKARGLASRDTTASSCCSEQGKASSLRKSTARLPSRGQVHKPAEHSMREIIRREGQVKASQQSDERSSHTQPTVHLTCSGASSHFKSFCLNGTFKVDGIYSVPTQTDSQICVQFCSCCTFPGTSITVQKM